MLAATSIPVFLSTARIYKPWVEPAVRHMMCGQLKHSGTILGKYGILSVKVMVLTKL